MFKKSIFLIGAVLFLISFLSMPVSSQDVVETKTINGSILAIEAATGIVELKNESGETTSLKAGSDINLEAFSEGQHVTIECSNEGIIINMTKAD